MRWLLHGAVLLCTLLCIENFICGGMKRSLPDASDAPTQPLPEWMRAINAAGARNLSTTPLPECQAPALAAMQKRVGGAANFTAEERKCLRDIVRMCEEPGYGKVPQVVFRTGNGQDVTYVRVPSYSKGASSVGTESLRIRARFMESVGKMIDFGTSALARYLGRNKEQSLAAIADANLPVSSKVMLSPEQSLDLMGKLRFSWNMMRVFRQLLVSWGAPLAVASTPLMQEQLKQYTVPTEFRTVPLECGGGKTVDTLVASCSLFEVVIQDCDQSWANGTFVSANLACNQGLAPRGSWVVSQDYGGGQGKWTCHSIDRLCPCSVGNQKRFCSVENKRPDDLTKADENASNFRKVVENVDGLSDLGRSMVLVRVGNAHTIVPAHIIPVVWSCTVINGTDKQLFLDAAWGVGTPAERAVMRAELIQGSGKLIVCDGMCLGVQSGDVTFPFRTPAPVTGQQVPAVDQMAMDVFVAADLLAMSVIGGMEGQSGCNCLWCRGAAKDFKLTATDSAFDKLILRTAASQAADLRTYMGLTTQNPAPCNGVSTESIFPFDFEKFIPGWLHVVMGPVNFDVSGMHKKFVDLDKVDTVRMAALLEASERVADVELDLIQVLSNSKEILGPEAPVVRDIIGDNDIGVLVAQLPLTPWSRISTALTSFASLKAEEAAAMDAGVQRGEIESLVDELVALGVRLVSTTSEVETARTNLTALESEPVTGPVGTLTALFSSLLLEYNISVQKYWNGTLVGESFLGRGGGSDHVLKPPLMQGRMFASFLNITKQFLPAYGSSLQSSMALTQQQSFMITTVLFLRS